ncbi:MAG: PEP-CTERM sorting domain-containing protein [Phycisphaeraceae bacterium]|nr:PEP-CTERM sorting domain-containing protein [Phycisphaeraceae bacterium]
MLKLISRHATYTVAVMFIAGSSSLFAAALPPVTTGLIGAYDASDVTLDTGGGVMSWNDQSGNGNHAMQATEAKQPVVNSGAMPAGTAAVSFAGAQYLQIASNSADFDTDQWTWYAVFQTDDASSSTQGRILSTGYADMDPGPGVVLNYTEWALHPGGGSTAGQLRAATRELVGSSLTFRAANSPAATVTTAGYYIGGGVWDDAGLSINVIIVDESNTRSTGTTALTSSITTPQGHTFTRIGNGSGTTSITEANHFDGLIAEILLYNRVLSASEQTDVEAYLYNKHLAIPEPASAALLGIAACCGLLRLRR